MPIKATVDPSGIKSLKQLLKELKKPIDKSTAEKVGATVVSMMKQMISKGLSPIKGNGRFPAYKDPDKYPGKRKNKRPVNLYLTGEFLDSLKFIPKSSKSGFDTVIYYDGKESELKEQGHREGANGQPLRPTIPQGGEKFAETIRIAFSKIYRQRLKDLKAKARGK